MSMITRTAARAVGVENDDGRGTASFPVVLPTLPYPQVPSVRPLVLHLCALSRPIRVISHALSFPIRVFSCAPLCAICTPSVHPYALYCTPSHASSVCPLPPHLHAPSCSFAPHLRAPSVRPLVRHLHALPRPLACLLVPHPCEYLRDLRGRHHDRCPTA